MKTITILIETHNEGKNLQDCINSSKLLTEHIVLIDMESTDDTVDIAKRNNIPVFFLSPRPLYVEPARKFGIQKITSDWVMILDPDERMTSDLSNEIREKIQTEKNTTHYKIPRKNMFGGKYWLKNGGWWPDEQYRLIHIPSFIDWPENIHSTPKVKGECGMLKHAFIHLFHGNISEMVAKTATFEDIESSLLHKAGRPVKTSTFFRKFFGELNRRLLRDQGFRDGKIGIIEAIYQAFSKTITYLFLYEKSRAL